MPTWVLPFILLYVVIRSLFIPAPNVAEHSAHYASRVSALLDPVVAAARMHPHGLISMSEAAGLHYVLRFDSEGVQYKQSYSEQPKFVSISDRSYYKEAKAGRTEFWYGPYTSRNALRPAYSYVVRLGSERFEGLLLFVVTLDLFYEACSSSLAPGLSQTFVNDAGTVVFGCGAEYSATKKSHIANFSHGQIITQYNTEKRFIALVMVEALLLLLGIRLYYRFHHDI